jgi:hypothetical protein
MSFRSKIGPLRLVRVVLYTREVRLSGFVRSPYHRLSDTLNDFVGHAVELHEVTTQPLRRDRTTIQHTDSAVVSIDEVVLAMPRYTVGVERSPEQQALVRRLERVEGLVEAEPFLVKGTLHVNPGSSLEQHIREADRRFLPMTHATGLFSPLPRPVSFRAPVLLVNREHIRGVWRLAEADPRLLARFDDAQNYLAVEVPGEIGSEAARILRRTLVFRGMPADDLLETCREISAYGYLSLRLYYAGTEVFREGDAGDSVYVVDRGRLQAVVGSARSGGERHVAYLGPGDLFGELAALDEPRRPVTVRAVEESNLLVVQAQGFKTLIQKFPSAVTTLLALVVQRQQATEAARGI